jgi:hypothetical protein
VLVVGDDGVDDAAMGDSKNPRMKGLLLVAGILTLVVSLLRLLGERKGWDAHWFNPEAGKLAGFGIVWLIPIFGFLFGRRLAKSGSVPRFVTSFFVPMFAALALFFAGVYCNSQFEAQELRDALRYVYFGGPVLALAGLFVWPRAFTACLLYGVLARVPVVVLQYLDIQNGWQTHYGKVHPGMGADMSADDRLWILTLAQAGFWLPFTVLLAGGMAALGAATVRKA